MIHRRSEGEKVRIGINWQRSKYTKMQVLICLPMWFYLPSDHYDIMGLNIIHGWQVEKIAFGFHWSYANGYRWVCITGTESIGKQVLVKSSEDALKEIV
jgi:hypothetical protein